MSSKRPPAPPPDLRGFDFVQHLGSGGFADVYLYQQRMPKRRVAVKVLLPDKVSAAAASDFTAEANVMAQLSGHPAIVSIYEADVSRDGRPYLVMEYCPKPNLQARYRKGPFSVAEALRIGIQIAGAAETAHRAGVIHRDIKPANVLVTEYNRPALTDFGIAATAAGESAGMSVPWSPPESFIEGVPSAPALDVWALGATVYTLLAGYSPFELPGHKNTSADLMSRIQTSPVPPLERADAPESLLAALRKSMAKAPGDRFPSAIDFGRALQKVQIELQMAMTPIDVVDDSVDDEVEEDEDDGRTRVRAVRSINPEGTDGPGGVPLETGSTGVTGPTGATGVVGSTGIVPAAADEADDATVVRPGGAAPGASATDVDDRTVVRGAALVADDRTVVRPSTAQPDNAETSMRPAVMPERPTQPKRSPVGWMVGAAAAVVLVGGGIAATLALGGGDSDNPTASPSPTVMPVDDVVIESQVPQVEDVTVVSDGDGVWVVSWTNPSPREGDTFLWGVQVGGDVVELNSTPDTGVELDASDYPEPCVEVFLRRADGRSSGDPGVGCAGEQ